MNIKIKKLRENAIIPTRGSDHAAGYDLYAAIDSHITIRPGETVKIGTGLSIELPDEYAAFIMARSGLATKQGLRPANCVGLVDPDYRGEYIVAVHNDSNIARTIEPNERIAQLMIVPFMSCEFSEVAELSDTDRGAGGFGSTGK